eukprot:761552-Hanusia_phi.AAC.4
MFRGRSHPKKGACAGLREELHILGELWLCSCVRFEVLVVPSVMTLLSDAQVTTYMFISLILAGRLSTMSGYPYNTWYGTASFSTYPSVFSANMKDFYDINNPMQKTPVTSSFSPPPISVCLGPDKEGKRKKSRLLPNCEDVTIFPRRKSGQDKLGSNRPPIVITRQKLEGFFNMPQHQVCKKLGVCATVIKKVCRQLGIAKWPFKGNKIVLRKQGLFAPIKSESPQWNVPAQGPSIQADASHKAKPARSKTSHPIKLEASNNVQALAPNTQPPISMAPLPCEQRAAEQGRTCQLLPSLVDEPLFPSNASSSLSTEASEGTEVTSSEAGDGFDLSWLVPDDSDLEILDGLQLPAAQ